MKKILAITLGLSLIGCGGAGSSDSDTPIDSGAGGGTTPDPFEIKLNANVKALSYAAFKVNSGVWNQITSDSVSVSVDMADDIEFVSICQNEKPVVNRIKVRGTVNLDYSNCLSDPQRQNIQFESDSSKLLVGISTNTDVSASKTINGNKATLAFKSNPALSQTSLVVIGKEVDGNTFYFHQKPSVVLSSGSVHTIDFDDGFSSRALAIAASATVFPTEFSQSLHLPSMQKVNLTALSGSLSEPTSALIDLRKFDDGTYFSDNWSFGSSSNYSIKNEVQFTEKNLPLTEIPEELEISETEVSQDGLTVTFVDKPFVGNSLIISEYEIHLSGHSVAYHLDPLLLVGNKTFDITDFTELPGLSTDLLPGGTVSSVHSLSASYTSPTYPDLGSSKLVVGSK